MYTLMHISDLHRSKANPISNDELQSSLMADCQRFSTEEPPVPLPNAIVVSGDLVAGLALGSANYPADLKEQYSEALELLARFADTFVGGDHSKIIIIPGNHDVDWNMSKSAMIATGKLDKSVQDLLAYPNNKPKFYQILFTSSLITKQH